MITLSDAQKRFTTFEDFAMELHSANQVLAGYTGDNINNALGSLATLLRQSSAEILEINKQDVLAAQEKQLSPAMIDRLTLNEASIEAMAQSVETIRDLDDPVHQILEETHRPNGLKIQKISVPIGVLGMIYESRPNVTIDAAALCLKSRNCVMLRGGSESFQTSFYLYGLVRKALRDNKIIPTVIAMLPFTDRQYVTDMLNARDYIDVIIPRGGKGLTGRVMKEATMPVFAHLDGNCHIYVHEDADPQMAKSVTHNAKLRRTGICGAMESLLIHENFPHKSDLIQHMLDHRCTIKGCSQTMKLDPRVQQATDDDWETEYLDTIFSCKIIDHIETAISWINISGSHHTDSIITQDPEIAALFLKKVDSAITMHNASTQFADGGEFGMGAEIGIGTGKLHARGPVGLKQLTTFKYQVLGEGHTRP